MAELFQRDKSVISRHIKNVFDEGELEALNRIVTVYLEFTELQAMNHKAMYMADWITKPNVLGIEAEPY
jgi:hypothetical protein